LANQVCSAYTVPQLNRFSIIFMSCLPGHYMICTFLRCLLGRTIF
jgi:hypothetical protein